MAYENILVDIKGKVGVVTLNRPKVLNALNADLCREIGSVLAEFETDSKVSCVVFTGSEKSFAAGADIKEMQSMTYIDAFCGDFGASWEVVYKFRKPTIAAVAGYALGGGCELAMMCDIIFASDTAKFGQPEITLGVMPGIGGTQRLTRLVGKPKAMDLCLTGRMMDAQEAERAGLVARTVPGEKLLDVAMETADKIASYSLPIAMMTKEAVNRAYETTLSEGIQFERRMFHSAFATEDQSEGMAAFVDKRKPNFKNK